MKDKLFKEMTEIENKLTSATGEERAMLLERLESLQTRLNARSSDEDDADSAFDNMPV